MDDRDPETVTVPPDGGLEAEQPRWRQDFPIDSPQDEYVARRDFTKFMVLTSFAFTVGQFWILAQNFFRRRKPRLPVNEIARVDHIPVGGALVFEYPQPHRPAVLVRLDEARFVAYDQKCTHLSCPVIPHVEQNRLHCPCHEGSFDLATGRPLAGPPRRPLPRITLHIRDGRIYAAGVEERTV
ncbi:MAG: ubiquinol-cytochrome c reductase iron-sulfur subunit [Candidatus Binatia bacterium]